MHEKIFANQKAIGEAELVKNAEPLDLDTKKFKECLNSGRHAEEIKKRMAEGQKAGITERLLFFSVIARAMAR